MGIDSAGLLHKLYTTALFDGGLSAVLSDLATGFPDLPISYQAQCVFENKFYDCATFNMGSNAVSDLARAESANPLPPVALKCDLASVARTSDFIRPEEVEHSDFYDEYLRHHGNINRALGVVLYRQGTDSAFVAANLPRTLGQREEEAIMEVFSFLRPHLQGAFKLLLELEKREARYLHSEFWLDQIPTAACVVEPDGKILHLNRQAEQVFQTSDNLHIDRSVRLTARASFSREVLQIALSMASANGTAAGPLALTPHGRAGSLLFVTPIRHQEQVHPSLAPFVTSSQPLLVTILDPEEVPIKSERSLAAAFGLTQRESFLLQELILGASLRDAAERLDISYFTARNHLASITSKTGCHSQSEIIRKGSQFLAKLSARQEVLGAD